MESSGKPIVFNGKNYPSPVLNVEMMPKLSCQSCVHEEKTKNRYPGLELLS